MPSRELPSRPDLDHLKREARSLQQAARSGDPGALQRLRLALGNDAPPKLTDAQRAIAREYGFATWARLRAHVQASRGSGDAINTFLFAVQAQDPERAREVLRTAPDIAKESLHVAAALGHAGDASRLIGEDKARVRQKAGDPAAEPLLFLCFSPFHGESAERDARLLATARLLLDAGADPNTKDGRYGVPALYAVTGARSVLPLARMLLDAGANPTDGESVFHAAQLFHEDALELLLKAGADLNFVGDWGNTALYFLLTWHDIEREPKVGQGVRWLFAHGADPNVLSGKQRETALHVAARKGQSIGTIQLLLDHGADLNATRADGSTAWVLARRGGHEAIAELLQRVGAETRSLSPLESLLAACGRGDGEEARRLTSPELLNQLTDEDRLMLVEAAQKGRTSMVAACVAAGFPVNATDSQGATALHFAAIDGRAKIVRMLLAAGADTTIRDKEHSSTPMGWACWGADFVADADGDYADSVRALLEAGARKPQDEHTAQNPAVRAVLEEFRSA